MLRSRLAKSAKQFAYGLGTARMKKTQDELDEEIVKPTVMAIKTGAYHLDGAAGILCPF